MNNTLTYNGYTARIEFDPEDRIFFGRIAGIRDIITFHGETVDELISAFEEAVDDYLEVCARLGQQPNKAYSGKLLLRLPSEVHAAVAAKAELSGTSINRWAVETLRIAATA
jgi:predicted HicB family RNase H-like nuclease